MLPKDFSAENFASRVVISLAEARESRKQREAAKSHAARRAERDQLAAEWRRQLVSGQVTSRAELARREGVSRAWVTKVLG